MSSRAVTGCAVVLILLTAGCSGTAGAGGGDGDRPLTVLAAASLTETFTELESVFEAEHPGVEVRLAFDSSATLAQQAAAGAPADVLATADAATMQRAAEAGALGGAPRRFARNTLVLVTPADDPADIGAVTDLDDPDVTYLACVVSTPCGALARELLDRNRVRHDPASLEVDVKAVLAKVVLDEADAGLVYATDAVAAAGSVRRLPVPGADQQPTPYLVAPLTQAAEPGLARSWIELLVSSRGQAVLTEAGFSTP